MSSNTLESYNGSKEIVQIVHPANKILSYDQVKRLIAGITGVWPIIKHMCPNSCMAYTGPLVDHDTYLHCSGPCYNAEKQPQQTFDTIPIPFAIQALMQHLAGCAPFPGPNKIKDAQSYLVGHHPIAAINQHGGLPLWNANTKCSYLSRLYIILATADGPGMVYLNGLVGHSGKIGCHLWWAIFLADFYFNIVYVQGENKSVADSLSRMPAAFPSAGLAACALAYIWSPPRAQKLARGI
ncbi:hypothetical protein J132_06806 [Termitomyces sp. J132]|nr:hypothetical protein J132_06806 [Termitomyces sp. J132]